MIFFVPLVTIRYVLPHRLHKLQQIGSAYVCDCCVTWDGFKSSCSVKGAISHESVKLRKSKLCSNLMYTRRFRNSCLAREDPFSKKRSIDHNNRTQFEQFCIIHEHLRCLHLLSAHHLKPTDLGSKRATLEPCKEMHTHTHAHTHVCKRPSLCVCYRPSIRVSLRMPMPATLAMHSVFAMPLIA